MSEKGSGRPKQNTRNISIKSEMRKACLNPDYLVKKLSVALFKNTRHVMGYIHFYFRDESDHIVLICSKGRLKQIVVKSPDCKKDEYVEWGISQFRNHKHENVLKELYHQIGYIEIEGSGFTKIFTSYDEFIQWVIMNSKDKQEDDLR